MTELRDISPYQRLGLLRLDRFAAEKNLGSGREAETSGTRHLLRELLNGEPFALDYTAHKKPFLVGRRERISISHSHDLLAMLVNSREETGVDIELIREKVLKIRHKFLNAAEQRFAGDDLAALITLWAAKEAMYKVHGRKQLNFCTSMEVTPFSGDDLTGLLRSDGRTRHYAMRRERLGDYILVYILNEIPIAHPQAH